MVNSVRLVGFVLRLLRPILLLLNLYYWEVGTFVKCMGVVTVAILADDL